MRRRGFSAADISVVRSVYKLLYRDGLNRTQAMEQLRAHPHVSHPLLAALLDFIEKSQRGLARTERSSTGKKPRLKTKK